MRGIRLKKTEEYELKKKKIFKKRVEFVKMQGKMDRKRRKRRNAPNSQKKRKHFCQMNRMYKSCKKREGKRERKQYSLDVFL